MIATRFVVVFGLGAAMLLLGPSAARAATDSWSVASGTWSVGGNWGSAAPTGSDTAFIENGGTASVTQTGGLCEYLYLGGGHAGSVQMSAGSLAVGYAEYIGDANTGVVVQSGGTNGVTPFLYLGYNSGVAGSYTLSSSGLVSASTEYVGFAGSGTFTQSGGTNLVNVLYLGDNATASAKYALSSPGLLSAADEYVGFAGSGTFTQSGGTNLVNVLYLGDNATASAKYCARAARDSSRRPTSTSVPSPPRAR